MLSILMDKRWCISGPLCSPFLWINTGAFQDLFRVTYTLKEIIYRTLRHICKFSSKILFSSGFATSQLNGMVTERTEK